MLIFAIAQALLVLTRDSEGFEDLHDLVVAAVGHHPGILIVRFDNDPRHNLTDRGIATAISKLESSGVPIGDRIRVGRCDRRAQTRPASGQAVPPRQGESCGKSLIVICGMVARSGRIWTYFSLTGGRRRGRSAFRLTRDRGSGGWNSGQPERWPTLVIG